MMDVPFMFVIIWLLSGLFTTVMGAALLTYVVRTWQQIRSDREGSTGERILDGIDQLRVQLAAMNERLASLEQEWLPPGNDARPQLPASDHDSDGPD